MPTSTLQSYFRAVLDRLYPERYQRYGTGTAASTTTLTDAPAFATTFTQTSHLIGAWIRIATATTIEYAQIASVSAAGVVTFDRTLTSAVTGALAWAITYERHPGHIDSIITQVLRNTYTPRLFPLSSHIMTNDDNDMESTATITGMWTASGATQVKDTTIVYPTGTQSLKVTAAGANDYSKMAAVMAVTTGRQYWASVLEQTTTADAGEFRIVNVDSSDATIENATTDELTWNELSFYFTPPTGCERINAWLISTDASDVTYWDDLSIIDTNQRIFPTPSWLIWPEQLLGGFETPQGSGGVAGDNDYRTFERSLRPFRLDVATSSPRATQELMLNAGPFSGSRRYIYAMGPASALTLDTSTSFIDPDVVAANVCKVLKEPESLEQVLESVRRTTLNSHHKIPSAPNMAYCE